MKREKTKHKGVYKVGDTYYVTYYVGAKKFEKAVGPRLSIALKEKMEREGVSPHIILPNPLPNISPFIV